MSEDSRQGIKFMAFSMSKIVSNAKSASLEMKNKFAYGWWSLQAVMTPELVRRHLAPFLTKTTTKSFFFLLLFVTIG